MVRIATSEARKNFAEIIARAARNGERVKLTHYGKTVVVIVPKSDLAKLEDCESRDGQQQAPDAKPAEADDDPRPNRRRTR